MTLLDDTPACAGAPFDFDGFVARHSTRLRRILVRKTGDLHEADELLQEALLRAYQHRDSFVDDDGAAAWTTVVAQRLAVDRHRVARRSVSVAEVPDSGRVARDTADVVVANGEARVALDVLSGLPRRQAAIIWAREIEGLSYAEIAQRLELSEPTVRTVLSRGRQALRKEFLRRGHALPTAGLVPLAPALLALGGGRELSRPVRRLFEVKLLGAVAAAVLTAGVVTAAGPWTGALGADEVVVPVSPQSRVVEPALPQVIAPAADERPAAPAPEAVPAQVSTSTVPAQAPAPPAPRPVVPVGRTCAGASSVSGCVDDRTTDEGDRLSTRLPVSVPGVEQPGASTDHVAPCADLPSLPLTSCTPDDDGDSR
jgi:RNA polymerase sigma-70 factor (ECF subfamily)